VKSKKKGITPFPGSGLLDNNEKERGKKKEKGVLLVVSGMEKKKRERHSSKEKVKFIKKVRGEKGLQS